MQIVLARKSGRKKKGWLREVKRTKGGTEEDSTEALDRMNRTTTGWSTLQRT